MCELQHDKLPCPSLSPSVSSNSCLLSQWCNQIISSRVTFFSSFCQSFWTWGSFPMMQFFASGGKSIEASASSSVLPSINYGILLNLSVCICKMGTKRVSTLSSFCEGLKERMQVGIWSTAFIIGNLHVKSRLWGSIPTVHVLHLIHP